MNAPPKAAPPRRLCNGKEVILDATLRLLSYSEMAVVLGVPGREAARKAIETIPGLYALRIRLGRRVRWRESEVRAFLDGLAKDRGAANA